MSVDHNIVTGYGVRIPKEVLRDYQNAVDPEGERGDLEEVLDDLVDGFPLVKCITAGSYYENDAIEYALVIATTSTRDNDVSGFLDLKHAVITAEEKYQLRAAWWELVDHELDLPEPGWHVGGLWS